MSWLERCDVRVVNGDLFEQDVHSVVVPIECSLTFAHSLGQELLHCYGNEVRLAAIQAKAGLPDGRLQLGSGFSLPLEGPGRLRHLLLVAWWDRNNEYRQSLIEACVASALRKTFETGSTSLAMPLFGVNSRELRLQDLYEAVPKVLREFDQLRGSERFPVDDLRLVCRKQHVVDEMSRRLRDAL